MLRKWFFLASGQGGGQKISYAGPAIDCLSNLHSWKGSRPPTITDAFSFPDRVCGHWAQMGTLSLTWETWRHDLANILTIFDSIYNSCDVLHWSLAFIFLIKVIWYFNWANETGIVLFCLRSSEVNCRQLTSSPCFAQRGVPASREGSSYISILQLVRSKYFTFEN